MPAGGEGWAPRAVRPCPSAPSPSHCQPCRPSPPAVVKGWALIQAVTAFCWGGASSTPRPPSLAPRVSLGRVSTAVPAPSPAAPRCPRRIPAGSAHRDAVPIPGRCQPRARRGQLPGGLCNPVCSNLAISGRESRAQRRLTPGVAVGGAGPEGRSPWKGQGARTPGALGSPAPVPRGSAKPREGAAWGGSAVTAVAVPWQRSASAAPARQRRLPKTRGQRGRAAPPRSLPTGSGSC